MLPPTECVIVIGRSRLDIGTDGTLSGYRWSVERKRSLLKREGEVPHDISAAVIPITLPT